MTPSTHTLAFCLNFSSEFEPACLSLDWLIVPEYVCTASCVYLLVKMLVWVCFPACTWISGVGYSRHEQSRIKSIFILARQQSVLLLGDTATQKEEGGKKEQTILLLLPPSSFLSRSVTPSSSLSASSCSSSPHLSTAFLFFSFLLSRLKSPALYPPTVAATYFSLLSLLDGAPQCTVAGTGEWQTALCEVQGSSEISAGSGRFIKEAFFPWKKNCSSLWESWTDCMFRSYGLWKFKEF